jgi:hypothetical protein
MKEVFSDPVDRISSDGKVFSEQKDRKASNGK